MGELSGKVALVTGASQGIGAACARALAQAGAQVVCASRRLEAVEEVAAGIRQAGGVAVARALDVTHHEEAAALVEEVAQTLGGLHILVNNAGITDDQLFLRMKPESWRRVMATNLDGVFNVTHPAARIMLKQKEGRIITITSVVGLMGNPGQANYAAAKAGLVGFTKSLARELGSRNITVNAVAPGYIQTAMTEVLSAEQRQRLLASLAIPRLGTPEDVAAVVVFLAGPGASYITGEVINVSGGLYM
ncbi:MAG: 3-oxoacyl-[acyl-carrier-protein] reductase [Thermoanaerobaculum sp.]|nr:3-oxoacyl-[acyl-carrier-protein] reductase [Thermoanaerobaculum sp.]